MLAKWSVCLGEVEARQEQLAALQTAETRLARAGQLLQRLAGEADVAPADWQTVLARCQVS